MKKKKQEKTKSQKRVLIVSIVLALLIVAGATFAWFTSKDEVTNKLSASSNYGVTVVEDFTPPSNWTPGQKVNKDVALVNTGNVDAIVRASLSSAIDLTTEGTAVTYNITQPVTTETTTKTVSGENDKVTKEVKLGDRTANITSGTQTEEITKITNYINDFVELTKFTVTDTAEESETDINTTTTSATNEVKSIQAGGRLICEADVILLDDEIKDGTYYEPTYTGLYIFRRTSKSEADSDETIVEYTGYYYVQPAGTHSKEEEEAYAKALETYNNSSSTDAAPTYTCKANDAAGDTKGSATPGAGTYYKIKNIDVKDIIPENSTLDSTDTEKNTTTKSESVNKTVKADIVTTQTTIISDIDSTCAAYVNQYYASKNGVSTSTGESTATTYMSNGTSYKCYVSLKSQDAYNKISQIKVEVSTSGGTNKYYKYYYTYTSTGIKTISVTEVDSFKNDGNIISKYLYDYSHITYNKDNNPDPYIQIKYYTPTTVDKGKPVIIDIYLNSNWADYWTFDQNTNTFYYNYKLVQGTTSPELVTALKLDDDVTNDAYISFDYSLNIIADSVQVVVDTYGTETAEAVIGTWNNTAVDLEPTVYNSVEKYKTEGLKLTYTNDDNAQTSSEQTADKAIDAADTTSIKGITWAAYENSSTATN
jgi:alternate signal-mediated exported protein